MNKTLIEIPLIWTLTVLIIFIITPYRHEELELGIFISIILGTIISYAIYAGIQSSKK